MNEYDAMNRLTKVTDASGGVTTYTYTSGGCPSGCGGGTIGDLLGSITDAKGNVTSFEYDERDRLKKIINPLGLETIYTYDGKGNLVSKADPNGNILSYEYDLANRLVRKVAPDDIVNYNYDVKDNLIAVSDSDSSLSMSYDANARMLSVTTGGTTQPAVTLTYSYDVNGNRISMTSPAGTTSYTYDNQNRLISLTDPSSLSYTMSYDSLGRRTALNYPNGVTTTYSYDIASRLTSLLTQDSQPVTLNSYTYNYDTVGNRTSLAELTGTHDYTYDNIYQLTDAAHPSIPAEQFSYDLVGNRLTDASSNTYNYNTANQLLDYDGTGFDYDNNGNMIAKTDLTGTTTYTYDSENRLTRIDFSGGGFAEYKYDAFGRRIEKDVNGQITKYVYDKEDIILEYDGSNQLVARFIHNLLIDDPLAIEKAGQTYYYHKDALGSITLLTDDSGSIAQTYEYDSFGNFVSQTGTIIQPFTYTGREYDSESGLYYYRARYYDAKAGRFISEDPIGFDGGINFFVYVGNNPVNRIDPLGLYTPIFPPGWDEDSPFKGPSPLGGCFTCDWYKLPNCLKDAFTNPACGECVISKNLIACRECLISAGITLLDSLNCRSIPRDECGNCP